MPPRQPRRQYSEKELQQVVHEHHVLSKTVTTISRDLNIPKSTVAATIKRWGETGKVKTLKQERWARKRGDALTDEAWDYLKAMVELDQAITLKGTAERLETSFGIRATLKTIRNALNKLGYSRFGRKCPQALIGGGQSEATLDNSRPEGASSGQSREPSVSGRSST